MINSPDHTLPGTLYKWDLHPPLRQMEEGRELCLVSATSQFLSAQNNPYAKVAYFGMDF